jgi:hypothetical protein
LTLAAQAKMSKEYPSHYSSTALMSTMGAIQATAFGLCVERDWSQWKLGWNIRLLAVAYSVYILFLNLQLVNMVVICDSFIYLYSFN